MQETSLGADTPFNAELNSPKNLATLEKRESDQLSQKAKGSKPKKPGRPKKESISS